MSTNESTPKVGRWRVVGHESLPVWTCDCGYYPYMAHVVTAPCGCTRPPMTATPAPSASEIPNNSSETPAPRVGDAAQTPAEALRALADRYHAWVMHQTGGDAAREELEFAPEMHAIADAIDAQVVGKEPIAGVSEAMIDAAMRADGFGYAAISDTLPDLVAQAREWYRRILSAALRAIPVEGDEPVCYQLRQRGQSGHWLRWESYDSESMRDGFLPRDAEYELRTLYAHPAPDGDIRTALLRFIDTAGNKRDLVTPGQTCALLDLLNELHPEDRPDGE